MHTQDITVVQELDLGDHTLFVFSDQSIQIVDFTGEGYTADNVTDLTSDETYHLYAALYEVFKAAQ